MAPSTSKLRAAARDEHDAVKLAQRRLLGGVHDWARDAGLGAEWTSHNNALTNAAASTDPNALAGMDAPSLNSAGEAAHRARESAVSFVRPF